MNLTYFIQLEKDTLMADRPMSSSSEVIPLIFTFHMRCKHVYHDLISILIDLDNPKKPSRVARDLGPKEKKTIMGDLRSCHLNPKRTPGPAQGSRWIRYGPETSSTSALPGLLTLGTRCCQRQKRAGRWGERKEASRLHHDYISVHSLPVSHSRSYCVQF